jgi:4-amino-4-deoxy-L-arabinose transferase-like glycosyltransferase
LKAASDRIRALPQRYGMTTLILLGLIAVVGLGARAYVVVNPIENPADDSHAYYALAKALYEEGSFGGPEFEDSSDWSPGAPLLYAASFYATGGAREGTARIIEALMGVAAIFVVFALANRLGGRFAGLLAALAVAVYPPFIHSTGELMSEPPAMLTLPAAILAFLWAADARQKTPARGSCHGGRGALRAGSSSTPLPPRHPRLRWLLPGFLFGATAMIRPEYLLVGIAFIGLAGARVWIADGRRPGLVAALLFSVAMALPIVPWTVRNVDVLGRAVPISTGSGKALYVGTFLPADGEYQRVKAILVKRYEGRTLDPHSRALEEVDPTPLFDRVAARYPDLPRDSALGKIGRENFDRYFGEDPLGYLGMTARKVGRMWSSGVGEAMSSTAGRAAQILLLALGLAGLALLALRRCWWELAVLATPILLVTAIGAASLAAPRRNEVLMTLVFPLAALTLSRLVARLSSGREWSNGQASSPPS